MNPSKLADEILKKIKNEAIQPRSKWFFLAKNISFWVLFGVATGFGAVSFAVILYATLNIDFSIADFLENENLITYWITFLPLMWILLIGVAVGLGIAGLKHTNRGYRIAAVTLIGSNVLGSVVLGSGLYAAGGAEIIEQTLEANIPLYQSTREKHLDFWGHPREKGRLAGKVTAVDELNQTMTIKGLRGEMWVLPYGENHPLTTAPEVGSIFKAKGKFEDEKFKPERMRPAPNQERLQKRVEDYMDRNPELRAKAKSRLSPTTKAELDSIRSRGERPNRDLREKMRNEIITNTPADQRQDLGERFKERPPQRDTLQNLR